MTTWESTDDIRAAAKTELGIISDNFASVEYDDYDYNSGAIVTRVINAPYEAKALMESDNIVVNVSKYPEANNAEVCSSAFAVLSAAPTSVDFDLYKERAMQVIY